MRQKAEEEPGNEASHLVRDYSDLDFTRQRNLPFLFLASKTSLPFVLSSSVLVMITDFAPEESIRSIACMTVSTIGRGIKLSVPCRDLAQALISPPL